MAVIRNLVIRAGADFSQMKKSMDAANKDLKNFGRNIKTALGGIAVALGGIGIGMGLGSAIEDAIKFEALMGTISRTLGTSMKDFVKWQQTVGDAMGFSKLASAEMGNNFSLRLKSIAKDEQDLLKKTTDLIKAAAVIRSRTGMSQIEISDRMRSAMNQEADGADELGVNVRVAAIQQSKAYKMMANNAPWEQLSDQMKKTILYYHILDSTTSNFGTEIAENTALLKGGFVAALADTKLALGQAFLPILNLALPVLTEMARRAEAAFKNVAMFMRALFPKSNIKAGESQTAVIDAQAEALNDLGDAGKAAKGALAGFDEINSLSSPSTDVSGTIAPITSPNLSETNFGAVDEAGSISTKIQELADNFRKALKDFLPEEEKARISDSFARLKTSFNEFGESVKDLAKTLVSSPVIRDFFEKFKIEKANQMASVIDSIAGGIKSWAGTLQLLSGIIGGDFEKALGGFEKNISGAYDSVTGFIGIFSPETAAKMQSWKQGFSDTWASLKAEIKKYGDPAKFEALDVAEYIRDKVSTKFGEMQKSLSKTWETLSNGTAWDTVKTKIVGHWEEMKGETGTKWDEFKTILGEKWTAVKSFIKWDEIKDTIVNTWDTLRTETGTKWDALKTVIGEKWGLITKIDFSGVNTGLLAIWNTLSLETGKIWDGMTKGIKDSINTVIDLINGFLDKVNSIKIDIPSVNIPGTDIKLGGGSIGMPKIPNIPKLARGGIVSSPMIAQIGEAGSEMVVPLENTSFVDKLAGALGTAVLTAMQFNNSNNNNNKSGDINLIIDGVTIARAIGPYMSKENNRIGSSMIRTT